MITAGVVTGILIVVLLLGFWRLSRGPISLAFLEPRLQWTFGAADQPMTLAIKGPLATWGGWRRPVDLRAGPVTLTDGTQRNSTSMALRKPKSCVPAPTLNPSLASRFPVFAFNSFCSIIYADAMKKTI